MSISAIHSGVSFKQDSTTRPQHPKSQKNLTAFSGGLVVALLGATAVTGIVHARKLHSLSALLTIGAALFHMETTTPKPYPNCDYHA